MWRIKRKKNGNKPVQQQQEFTQGCFVHPRYSTRRYDCSNEIRQGQRYTPRQVGRGESNERNPDPFVSDCLPQCIVERTSLGQRAALLALHDPRRAKPGAETRNDSGFGHNGWDRLFSLGEMSSVTNERKCRFVFYFINAASSSTLDLSRRNEWTSAKQTKWLIPNLSK